MPSETRLGTVALLAAASLALAPTSGASPRVSPPEADAAAEDARAASQAQAARQAPAPMVAPPQADAIAEAAGSASLQSPPGSGFDYGDGAVGAAAAAGTGLILLGLAAGFRHQRRVRLP